MDLKNRLKRLVQNPTSISKSTSFSESINLPAECRRSSTSATARGGTIESNLPSSSSSYTLREQRALQAKYIELFKDYNRERDFRSATKQLQNRDPLYDENLFKSIETIYFDAKNVTQCEDHILYNLPKAILDVDFIVSEKNRLKKQLSVVTRKVSELMIQHQPEYNEELQRVVGLQILLNDAINLTCQSRANLKLFKENVSLNILTVIYNEHRRLNATKVLQLLNERREHLSSKLIVNETSNGNTKDEVNSPDQLSGASSSNVSTSQNSSPQSKGYSPVINSSNEITKSQNRKYFNDDSRGNLPCAQSFDSLISSNIEKTATATGANLIPIEGRSNSVSPVPSGQRGGGDSSSSTHSPASR